VKFRHAIAAALASAAAELERGGFLETDLLMVADRVEASLRWMDRTSD